MEGIYLQEPGDWGSRRIGMPDPASGIKFRPGLSFAGVCQGGVTYGKV